MLTKRTNILFDHELWNKLVKFAGQKGTSVGKIIREAVKDKLEEEAILQKRQKAIEQTFKNRVISKAKIDYKELINYGRKY